VKKLSLLAISLFLMMSMPLGCYQQMGVAPPPSQEEVSPQEEAPPQDEYPPQESTEEAPPDVVVVPSGENYVYMVPNMFGVYFFGGSWYRYYNGYWFRANAYNEPWVPVAGAAVPMVIVNVPPEFVYSIPPEYHHIHYDEFHRGWRDWDRDRHWHQYDWYKHEVREDIRRERLHRINEVRERWRRGEGQRPIGFVERPKRRTGDIPPKPEKPTPKKIEKPVPAKPEPVAPKKVEKPVPTKPEPVAPKKVEKPVPLKPEPIAPKKVEKPVPAKPEPVTPKKVEKPAPPKPAPVTPKKIERPTPRKPEESTPPK